jgi:hypothetical protein
MYNCTAFGRSRAQESAPSPDSGRAARGPVPRPTAGAQKKIALDPAESRAIHDAPCYVP